MTFMKESYHIMPYLVDIGKNLKIFFVKFSIHLGFSSQKTSISPAVKKH
jgi:hypothetical protein